MKFIFLQAISKAIRTRSSDEPLLAYRGLLQGLEITHEPKTASQLGLNWKLSCANGFGNACKKITHMFLAFLHKTESSSD